MPLTEEEKQRIERAKENALSAVKHSYIENEEDLNWQIQRIHDDYKMIEMHLQRYTLSIVTKRPEIDTTFLPFSVQIHDDFQTTDLLANNIKVKVTADHGLITPETVNLQKGTAQVLLYPKKSEHFFTEVITAEIIDAPPKYAYLIGQKVTKSLRIRL